jgi:hypothetical protein
MEKRTIEKRSWPVRFKALIYCLSSKFFQPASSTLASKRRLFLADQLVAVIAKLPDTVEYEALKKCELERVADFRNICHNYPKPDDKNDSYVQAEAEAM